MSLKVVPFKSLGAVSYSPFVLTMAVFVAVCDIFRVKNKPLLLVIVCVARSWMSSLALLLVTVYSYVILHRISSWIIRFNSQNRQFWTVLVNVWIVISSSMSLL